MLEIKFSISSGADAAHAAIVCQRIAESLGETPSQVAEPARRTRNAANKAPESGVAVADTGKPDPVEQYAAAGGALPVTETVHEPVADAAPARTLDAKRIELRTMGRERGVTWLRETLVRFSVEALGELPEPAVDTLLAELSAAQAAA